MHVECSNSNLVVAFVFSPTIFHRRLFLSCVVNLMPIFLQRLFICSVLFSAMCLKFFKSLLHKSLDTHVSQQTSRTYVFNTHAVTRSPSGRQARGSAFFCLQRKKAKFGSAHSYPRTWAAHVRLVLSVAGNLVLWSSMLCWICVEMQGTEQYLGLSKHPF